MVNLLPVPESMAKALSQPLVFLPHKMMAPPPVDGVGTELYSIIHDQLKARVDFGCRPCNKLLALMNQMGADICRVRFKELLAKLRENAKGKVGFRERLRLVPRVIRTGIIFHINPFDPLPGMLRLAIRRAKKKELAKSAKPVADSRADTGGDNQTPQVLSKE